MITKRIKHLTRYLYITSTLTLLASPAYPHNCANNVPDSRNFIVSGKLFRKTIECLEKRIEQHHQSLSETIKIVEGTAKTAKANTTKPEDLISSISIALKNGKHQEKVLMISYANQTETKTLEFQLN